MTNHGTYVWDEHHDHAIEIPSPYILGDESDSFTPLANHLYAHARDIAVTRGWVRVNERVFWYSNCGLGGFHVEEVDPVEWETRPNADEQIECPAFPPVRVLYGRGPDGVWSVVLSRPFPDGDFRFLVELFDGVNAGANALYLAESLGLVLGAGVENRLDDPSWV